MASGNVTVTAAAKAGLAAVADNFPNVDKIEYDLRKEMIFILNNDGSRAEYPYDAIATVTHVIAGAVATITIST